MIDCIERITSNYGAGVHLSGKTGCKKNKGIIDKSLKFQVKGKDRKISKRVKKKRGQKSFNNVSLW